jgi:hypothetical protein
MTDISFDTLKKYFDMPMSYAARSMKISDTYLKKVCLKFNISRWPYRKLCFLKQNLYHVMNQYETTVSSYCRRRIEKYKDDISSFYNLETITRNNKKSDKQDTENYEPRKSYYSVISPDELNTMEVRDFDFGLLDEISSNKIFVDYSPTESSADLSKNNLFLKLDVNEIVKILGKYND